MPWSMKDYPQSLKNLEEPVKKKAIEIANAMIDEGYEEGRAIPIATSQAKEWKKNASKEEIDQLMKHDDETKRGRLNRNKGKTPLSRERGFSDYKP